MRLATLVIQNVLRLLAVLLLVLGFMFWSHRGAQFVPLHMGSGVVLVVLLWTLSVMGLMAGVRPALVIAGLLWGILVLWWGFNMHGLFLSMFPGAKYEIARVFHFLIGLGAIGMGEVLGKRIKLNTAARV